MTRGAIAPNSPNPPNPNADHAQAQIAMKQVSRPYAPRHSRRRNSTTAMNRKA